MLEGVPDLILVRFNEATQAWVEYEYNCKLHSEIGEAPIARYLAGPEVTRPCLDGAALKLAFTRAEQHILRKSDGTITIEWLASRCRTATAISPAWRCASPAGI